ncbi:hypothetical protein L914_15698 [Phytophthora nicotianae]|uniref:Uncharacterized protein n=2 Tax=Phytophthora nicotianae TaxID=4792 RepID=V9EF27_PHYNI|nr:hypothetical protein F443_16310 [Phytophthora nicotianae P1569]ETM37859.1 hypothetical protein L914_15698 [Phytophthora nicotianae]
MQFSNLQLPAWARSLIVEAWFGDDVVIAAQPELNLFTAALAALHWCIQTPARLWGWVLRKLRADPVQSCKLDLLPVALPAALPVTGRVETVSILETVPTNGCTLDSDWPPRTRGGTRMTEACHTSGATSAHGLHRRLRRYQDAAPADPRDCGRSRMQPKMPLRS